MVSKNFIDEISWEIVELYMKCESNLLNLIIKKAKSGADLTGDSLEWDLHKLNNLGGLTKGAIKIIGATSKRANKALNRVLLEVAKKALNQDGIEGEPSKGVFSVVQALQAQAKSRLNLVNTTMLAGVQDQYGKLVNILTNERNKGLNEGAMYLVTGQKTFQQSVAHAIKTMADEGITAYQDAIGRNWTPEGYVSMDMRTTSANVAREAVQAEANDFGLHVYQVSSHAGARPKCAVNQGKFFSDNGTRGEIEDAYGEKHEFVPQEEAQYWGDLDGLFGINCGHDRIYVSTGFYNRREPLTAEELEADRKVYEISQQQRAIERDIRKYKRETENLKDAGYTEFAKVSQANVTRARSEYKTFCEENGRTERWDRTQIY